MIKFKEKDHSYTKDDKVYTSVTTLVHKFTNPFDEEYWSLYKAIEAELPSFKFQSLKRKYGFRNIGLHLLDDSVSKSDILETQLEIKTKWKKENRESTILGTKYHLEKERESYELGKEFNMADLSYYPVFEKERIEGENTQLLDDLYYLEDGYYPELLLWNNEHMIAGQADKVFISTLEDMRFIDIGDYKTNKEIKTENTYDNMISPLDHLMDCNLNHYYLQLSTYAYLLEQFGYNVRNISFDHNKLGLGEEVRYEVPYLKKEVELMLKYKNE